MTTNTEATVDAIRRAWGIRISQAEADSAACVIENRRLLRPDKPTAEAVISDTPLGSLLDGEGGGQ